MCSTQPFNKTDIRSYLGPGSVIITKNIQKKTETRTPKKSVSQKNQYNCDCGTIPLQHYYKHNINAADKFICIGCIQCETLYINVCTT